MPSADLLEARAERDRIDGEKIGIIGVRGLVSEAYGRKGAMMLRDSAGLTAQGWSGTCLGVLRMDRLADDFARARAQVRDGCHLILFEAAGGEWLVPTSLAAGFLALWAWLGEFVAACTRLGRRPVIDQGLDVPGASERSQRLRRRKVHAQPPQPVAPGWIAGRCVAELGTVLHHIRCAERQQVRQAAAAMEGKGQGRRLDAFPRNPTLVRGRLGGAFDPGTFRQINRDWFHLRHFQRVSRGELVFCVSYSRLDAEAVPRSVVSAIHAGTWTGT